MAFGYDIEKRVNLSDTADLRATLFHEDGQPWPAVELAAVAFQVQLPDGSMQSVPGLVEDDGTGVAVFNGTGQVGHYAIVASFTTIDGRTKSTRSDIDVIDPFLTEPTFSPTYLLATQVWAKIEDCFDGELEGPYLREATLNTFNREKMEGFIDFALFDLNQLNPPTSLAMTDFIQANASTGAATANTNLPVLTQGVFVQVLRHLMTSYVEQPLPSGAATQVGWQDRRDYLTRWATMYAIEFQQYDRMAKLYKRQFLGLGRTAMLISSKAGRLIPAPMRSWSIGAGYW